MAIYKLNESNEQQYKGYTIKFNNDGRCVILDKNFDLVKSDMQFDEAIEWIDSITESLKEASYGGAYDIEDDMFFTKEELVEFGEDIVEEFNKQTGDNAYLGDIYFNDNSWTPNMLYIEVDDEYSMYDAEVRIDMRKIKLPRDIYKYKKQVLAELEKQYEDYHQYDNYYESYRLKESDEYDPESYDINDVWTAVCSGDLENVKRLITDYEEANERYNRFGKEHSLIMGAARNNESEVVSYLISIGGTIEPHETFEFAKYIKNNNLNIK